MRLSDYEDEDNTLVLPDNYAGRGNRKSNKSAIKLAEIGPRITFKLLKVQNEICKGEVLYHAFLSKDEAEKARLKAQIESKERKKQERVAIQAANVKRKQLEKETKLAAKKEKIQKVGFLFLVY